MHVPIYKMMPVTNDGVPSVTIGKRWLNWAL